MRGPEIITHVPSVMETEIAQQPSSCKHRKDEIKKMKRIYKCHAATATWMLEPQKSRKNNQRGERPPMRFVER